MRAPQINQVEMHLVILLFEFNYVFLNSSTSFKFTQFFLRTSFKTYMPTKKYKWNSLIAEIVFDSHSSLGKGGWKLDFLKLINWLKSKIIWKSICLQKNPITFPTKRLLLHCQRSEKRMTNKLDSCGSSRTKHIKCLETKRLHKFYIITSTNIFIS